MNTQDGMLFASREAALLAGVDSRHLMMVDPTDKQRRRMKVGRNDPCPCGSGKKFKKCHLGRPVETPEP